MFSVVIPAQDIRFIRGRRYLIKYVLVQQQMIHCNCFSLFKRMFTRIFVHVSLILLSVLFGSKTHLKSNFCQIKCSRSILVDRLS